MKRFIKYLIMVLLTLSSFGLLFYVFKLNVLTNKLFMYLAIGVSIIYFILMLLITRKNKFIKYLAGFISIILITIYGIGARYISSTIDYTKKITDIKYETINYKVLTLSDSEANEILDLTDKKIGFMETDKYLSNSKDKLKKRFSFKNKTYKEIGTMIGKLYEGEIDALVVNDSYLELLEENNVAFTTEDKEIYSYEIKVISVENDEEKKVDVTKDPFIVYISGSDSRGSVSDVARSDVNIVVVINPEKRKVLLVSIPRDYYVQLHDTYGYKDKLTHAGVYGIDMSITTIEDLLGIDINYYTKVSFNTVVNLVDTIDGIDIYSDTEFKGSNNCYYVVGDQHLNGECALRFARERYSYESGDRHRGQNQQAVITAIINKLTNPKYLIRYEKILKNTEGTLETNMSYDEITNLVKYESKDLKSWEVESISLDGWGSSEPTYSMGEQLLYVMIPDESTINIAKEKITEYLEK